MKTMKEYKITLFTYNMNSSFNINLSPSEYKLMKTIENATDKGKLMVQLGVEENENHQG